MVLVIGGLASGKRAYVKQAFGFSDGDMADAVLDTRPVVFNVQDIVFSGAHPYPVLLETLLEKQVVICNEVGSGVVPIDKAERAAREAAGRLCVALAEKAEKVIRLYSGIPSIIKG
jgi:adenosyl cobinamide kinase/adenosyl cobinamide phosphate guanylyltransferase